jgi:integrase
MPRWGNRDATTITRADARALVGSIKAPITTNQALAAASAVFTWAVRQEIVAVNPCRGVDANPTMSRDRILSDSEVKKAWDAIGSDAGLLEGSALKVILLTGQRPGEVTHMRREHVRDGWWELPGQPDTATGWPGTKNGKSHRVWLTQEVRAILDAVDDAADAGLVFATGNGSPARGLDGAMRDICKKLSLPRATPHDLRRTFGSTVTALGFGRQAMDRILNHSDSGVGSVYDRHSYVAEDRRIMEAVARHVTRLVESRGGSAKVVRGRF